MDSTMDRAGGSCVWHGMGRGDRDDFNPLDDLSCHCCGYLLRGLTRAGLCPECGEPVLSSLMARRSRRRMAVALGPLRTAAGCMVAVCAFCLVLIFLAVRHRPTSEGDIIVIALGLDIASFTSATSLVLSGISLATAMERRRRSLVLLIICAMLTIGVAVLRHYA